MLQGLHFRKIHPSTSLPGSDSPAAGAQQGASGAHPSASVAGSGAGVEDGRQWQCYANHAASPFASRDQISGQYRHGEGNAEINTLNS